jgi:hypothetical protein
VNLPLTDTYSCQNFCGPTARCSVTGQQCSADIDCPGCNPYKQTNEVNTIYKKNKEGNYIVNGKTYNFLIGTRQDVWDEIAFKTTGGLKKENFIINSYGKIVSKKKSILETENNRLELINEKKKKQIVIK